MPEAGAARGGAHRRIVAHLRAGTWRWDSRDGAPAAGASGDAAEGTGGGGAAAATAAPAGTNRGVGVDARGRVLAREASLMDRSVELNEAPVESGPVLDAAPWMAPAAGLHAPPASAPLLGTSPALGPRPTMPGPSRHHDRFGALSSSPLPSASRPFCLFPFSLLLGRASGVAGVTTHDVMSVK